MADLLEEAKKLITESPESSGRLRLLEISTSKITNILQDDVLLECLNTAASKTYRIEEVPKDEEKLEPGEFMVPVAHFHKEVYQTFGTPFLLKLKQREPFSSVKDRVQKKLDLPDKEFEKVCSSQLYCNVSILFLKISIRLRSSHPAEFSIWETPSITSINRTSPPTHQVCLSASCLSLFNPMVQQDPSRDCHPSRGWVWNI